MAKGRKKGDWKAVASARDKIERTQRTGHGLTNIPDVTETGSAAYRRMRIKRSSTYGK